MPYDDKNWVDGPDGGTPIDAASLNHIEQGILDAVQEDELGSLPISADQLVETAGNKVLTSAERLKLAGIATGATANDTDAALRDRSTHTGSQPSATISDLVEFIQDTVATLLVPGANITLTYNDGAGSLVIASTGTGSGMATTGNVVSLDGDTQQIGKFTVVDDGTNTSSWPNRLEFFFSTGGTSRHTSYFNEYGEFRGTCAKSTTTGARVFTREFSTDTAHSTTIPVFDIMDDRDNRTILAGFFSDGRLELVGSIKASNLPPGGITVSATAPSSPQLNQAYIDLSS